MTPQYQFFYPRCAGADFRLLLLHERKKFLLLPPPERRRARAVRAGNGKPRLLLCRIPEGMIVLRKKRPEVFARNRKGFV